MIEKTTTLKSYCNVMAIERGLDPVGHAHDFDDAVVVETPLPWKTNLYEKAGILPQEAINLLNLWLQRYHEGMPYRHRSLMIAPDAVYSRQGWRRVMFYQRTPGAIAHFDKVEYLVTEKDCGPLLWALYEARETLPQFEQYRVPENEAIRDLMVCTHGTVDAACAKFGYPLYTYLRRNHASDSLRVWRVSHFGGHVFAPTLVDMPSAHYWAYVERAQADAIVCRDAAVESLRGHYRGWAGLEDGFLQAAEREMWQREGWRWFDYAKSGQVLGTDADHTAEPQWAEVRVHYSTPDNTEAGFYEARVEIQRSVETIHTTGEADTYPYPQYVVTRLERKPLDIE